MYLPYVIELPLAIYSRYCANLQYTDNVRFTYEQMALVWIILQPWEDILQEQDPIDRAI